MVELLRLLMGIFLDTPYIDNEAMFGYVKSGNYALVRGNVCGTEDDLLQLYGATERIVNSDLNNTPPKCDLKNHNVIYIEEETRAKVNKNKIFVYSKVHLPHSKVRKFALVKIIHPRKTVEV